MHKAQKFLRNILKILTLIALNVLFRNCKVTDLEHKLQIQSLQGYIKSPYYVYKTGTIKTVWAFLPPILKLSFLFKSAELLSAQGAIERVVGKR